MNEKNMSFEAIAVYRKPKYSPWLPRFFLPVPGGLFCCLSHHASQTSDTGRSWKTGLSLPLLFQLVFRDTPAAFFPQRLCCPLPSSDYSL